MAAVDQLRMARRVIANPRRWTQGGLARDKNGERVLPNERRAHKFCGLGALLRAAPHEEIDDSVYALQRAAGRLGYATVNAVNDIGTRREAHPRVLAMYDDAIREMRHAR